MAMKKKPPVTKQHVVNVGVMALARETGLSGAAVSKKMKAGQTPDQIRKAAAQRKGIKPPNTKGPGRPPSTPTEYDLVIKGRSRMDAMEEMKFRRAKALAERQEIENMLRRGELMPVAYARKWGIQFLMEGRDELLKGPSELADDLAAEADPVRVKAILLTFMERVIAKFEQLEMLWKGDQEQQQVA
jgi:hypothetical protein